MSAQPSAEAIADGFSDVSQARLSGAERTRRYRQRRAAGLRCIDLDVRTREVEWLISHNYLPRNGAEDPGAIGRALGRLLDRVIG